MSIDGLLAGMRDTVVRTLPVPVVEVHRRTRTRTPTGGSTYAWALTQTTQGRVVSPSAEDRDIADRLEIQTTHIVMVPYDCVATPDDRLKIDGEFYDIYAVLVNESQPVIKKVHVAKADAS